MRDPVFQAGKLGFKVGAVVIPKKKHDVVLRGVGKGNGKHCRQGYSVGLGRGQGFRNPKAEAAPDERLYTVKSVLDGKWMLAIEEAGVFVWVNTPELVTDWSVTKKTNSRPIARLHS